MGISTPSNATTVDRIRQIHGSAIANEMVKFEVSNEKWGFKASGWTTNANYHVKKTSILLFINHRSVESSAIKKAIDQTYSMFLPKGGHPFIYLNLNIDPLRLDVNVHPTKREVNFLNEDEIIECICNTIRAQLNKVDTSRIFTTQSLLPTSEHPADTANANMTTSATKSTQQRPTRSTPGKPYENNLVRTDASLRKITSMLPPTTHQSTINSAVASGPVYQVCTQPRTECRLTTIKRLRAKVRSEMHTILTETFASHTYVGLVDPSRRIVAIQSGVKLFLVDYGMVAHEFFYQLGLADFGNFGSITFEEPLDVRALITLAVEHERGLSNPDNEGVEWETVANLVTQQLVDRRDMLREYFNLEVSPDGELVTLPLLLKGYTPSMAKLPRFLLRLGPCVNWEDEEDCFDSFLRELASFYTPQRLQPYSSKSLSAVGIGKDDDAAEREMVDEEDANTQKRQDMERVLEHVFFPALRARLVAGKALLRGVIEVANLKGLYRVFERC